MRILPQRFYRGEVASVARALVGKMLCTDDVVLRITEVEAYAGPEDSASHSRFGRTDRNAAMWGPPGRAYMFLCYGVHHMLNIVTGDDGEGSAVLVRACEPVEGIEAVRKRRGARPLAPELLNGPGKVAASLGLDLSFNHHPLYKRAKLWLADAEPPDEILVGPRVGIDYASRRDRTAKLRFALGGSRWVSHRSNLR